MMGYLKYQNILKILPLYWEIGDDILSKLLNEVMEYKLLNYINEKLKR